MGKWRYGLNFLDIIRFIKDYILRIQVFRDYWVNEVSVIVISGYYVLGVI